MTTRTPGRYTRRGETKTQDDGHDDGERRREEKEGQIDRETRLGEIEQGEGEERATERQRDREQDREGC